MKKINVLIVSFLFLLTNNIQASLFQAPNPYSFGPEGRTVADLRDFAKPKQMVDILANRPVVATKSDGTRVYYTPDGKMSLSISEDGKMSFSVGGVTKSRNADGKLTQTTSAIRGENLYEVKNELNEVLGYKKVDGNGNTIVEYDKDMNKTKTYDYGKYGKVLTYSINEMNKQKTVYDEYERAMAVYTAEGRIITTYQYTDVDYDTDENCLELTINKKEVNAEYTKLETSKNYMAVNTSLTEGEGDYIGASGYFDCEVVHYGDKGLINYIVNSDGETTSYYTYAKDIYGNNVLTSVFDCKTQERTFYEDGKQMYTVNAKGGKIRQYYWDGSKYLFSADLAEDGSWTKTTNSQNITTYSNIVYNEDGTVNTVSDNKGNVIERYFYKEDSEGISILDYVENVTDGSKTYYDEKGQSTQTVDKNGNVITDYSWNKSNLVYSFDRETGVTTWYNENEQVVYKSLDDQIISKNIYSAGQLIAKWNAKDSTLSIYVNEQEQFTISLGESQEEPDLDYVRKIISDYIQEQDNLKKS